MKRLLLKGNPLGIELTILNSQYSVSNNYLCQDNDQVILIFSTEDEKEEESSEEEDEDKRRLNDELLGKVVSVVSATERTEWYPALVGKVSLQS